ncbi:hypothetical protein J4456_02390 [Candidatus Pacearchaeota archaeon]|nr:hypothetical protein [Candidatus Pacearchaeota archaeon]
MSKAITKRYLLSEPFSISVFEGDNKELYPFGLIHLGVHYDFDDKNYWESYWYHESGTAIKAEHLEEGNSIILHGLENAVKQTANVIHNKITDLEEVL